MPEYMLVATIVSDVPEYKIAQIEDKPRQMPIGTYVYQAMRVTGAADPTRPQSETLEGKLPQKNISTGCGTIIRTNEI